MATGLSKADRRRSRVLHLKLQGQSVQDIARELQISVAAARKYLRLALDQLRGDDLAREDRQLLEVARLDSYLAKIEPMIAAGELAAVDRALRIQERRANLLGLDAPKLSKMDIEQTTIHANLSDEALHQRIRALQSKLNLIPQAPIESTCERVPDDDLSFLD